MRANDESMGVRERILGAALDELSERGFGAASVRAIAARVGVTGAMINYYFGGKRALYEAVVDEAHGRLFARLSQAVGEGGSGMPARLALSYFDFLVEERKLQRLLLREVLDGGASVAEPARQVAALGRALGPHLGDDDAVLQLAISIFGAVAGYFIYHPVLEPLLGADPLSPERLARRRRHVASLVTRLQKENDS